MIQTKKQRFANEVARSKPSLPPIAHEGLRRSIRRHTLPGVPLQNEGGLKYRYSRREAIMRGLENLKGRSTSEK